MAGMAQLMKYLLQKHEDSSSCPRHPHKVRQLSVFVTTVLGERKTGRSLQLIGQAASSNPCVPC